MSAAARLEVPRDARFHALVEWLRESLGVEVASIVPASADASFRRYFRIVPDDGATVPALSEETRSLIAMDAPPPQEDCRAFVHVANLLLEAGLHAPRVLAQDLARGFLLLTDLGNTTYLRVLDHANAGMLFADARAALVRWQRFTRQGALPAYDAALLRRELELFPQWYVDRHLGFELDADARESLDSVFRLLIARARAQPQVFVHRDFMPRNLMVSAPNPGILDFQDAVLGPVTYDIVSLYRDAFVSWTDEFVLDGVIRYWEDARRSGVPVTDDFAAFWQDFEWMGLQRHLKVLGIFARIHYRDGKPLYLTDTPRFVGYARAVATRYDALAPLARLLDSVEGRRSRSGLAS